MQMTGGPPPPKKKKTKKKPNNKPKCYDTCKVSLDLEGGETLLLLHKF